MGVVLTDEFVDGVDGLHVDDELLDDGELVASVVVVIRHIRFHVERTLLLRVVNRTTSTMFCATSTRGRL